MLRGLTPSVLGASQGSRHSLPALSPNSEPAAVTLLNHANARRDRRSPDACRFRSRLTGVEVEGARSYRRDGSTCRPPEALQSGGWRRNSRQIAAVWWASSGMHVQNPFHGAFAPILGLRHFSQLIEVLRPSRAPDGWRCFLHWMVRRSRAMRGRDHCGAAGRHCPASGLLFCVPGRS
jgi:hypothetical protein